MYGGIRIASTSPHLALFTHHSEHIDIDNTLSPVYTQHFSNMQVACIYAGFAQKNTLKSGVVPSDSILTPSTCTFIVQSIWFTQNLRLLFCTYTLGRLVGLTTEKSPPCESFSHMAWLRSGGRREDAFPK